jgi:uncharacterized protein (TIGR03435 family)
MNRIACIGVWALLLGPALTPGMSRLAAAQESHSQNTQTKPQAPERMPADAHPTFDVATIKPHDPNSYRQGFNDRGGRFTIRGQSVSSLLMFAYSINKHQIEDLPDWASNATFDIDGITDPLGEPNLRQMQEMIQKLLADRFQLKLHRETRELPVYALQLEKSGPKLASAADPNAQPDQESSSHGTEITHVYTSCAMADFILGMQFFLDRPIVDQTGLTGRYDLKLRYTYNESSTDDPNAPPGLFTAIKEQLGLRLKASKAPIYVLVIDRIDQPSPN